MRHATGNKGRTIILPAAANDGNAQRPAGAPVQGDSAAQGGSGSPASRSDPEHSLPDVRIVA